MSNDWIASFFDKGRLVSDQDMQQIWAAMLAGEANQPGSFSKRTVDLVSTLDRSDADLFTKFCTFVWNIGVLSPLIFDVNMTNEFDNRINFVSLHHLEALGLIRLQGTGHYARRVPKELYVFYYGTPVGLRLP